jgi:hypothetical protein
MSQAVAHRKRDRGELENTQLRFFEAQYKFWNNTIIHTQNAINMAQNDYRDIFVRSTPPSLTKDVFVKGFITLTVAAFPEFAPAIFLIRSHEKEIFEKLAGAFADVTKDAREQLNETSDANDELQKKVAATHIEVLFFRDLYIKLGNLSNYVTNSWDMITKYITESDDPLATVTAKAHKTWMAAGLLTGPVRINQEQLSLLFLYDIMRAHTKQNVSLVNPPGIVTGGFSHLSRESAIGLMKDGKDIDFEGLDAAKRQAMYDRFADIRWKDSSRPPILDPKHGGNGWKDLLKYWEFSEG